MQICWSSYFRAYYMSNMIYENFYLLTDRLLAYNLGMVYFMGLGWGMNQVKSTINSIKDLFNKND